MKPTYQVPLSDEQIAKVKDNNPKQEGLIV
jgi:hypothetical protein